MTTVVLQYTQPRPVRSVEVVIVNVLNSEPSSVATSSITADVGVAVATSV